MRSLHLCACLKWLPRVSRFPTAGQGERRLWERDCDPTRFGASYTTKYLLSSVYSNSGFPSTRSNLSPFTKDFRGGEQLE